MAGRVSGERVIGSSGARGCADHRRGITGPGSPDRAPFGAPLARALLPTAAAHVLDGADGTATTRWARDNAAAMESLSTGVQFADDPGRPSRGISESAQSRLEEIRAVHDPEGRFNRWIGAVNA